MGGIQTRIKGLWHMTKTANSKIGNQSSCPKCRLQFSKDTTYQIFNNHLELCLANPSIIDERDPQIEIQIYIKKLENGKKNWVRHLVRVQQQILSLNQKEITKRQFGQKLIWFYQNIEKYRIKWQKGAENLIFKPQTIVQDSLKTMLTTDLHKQLKISVIDDKVNDAGGILRQWSSLIIKSLIFQYDIFTKANSSQANYKLSPICQQIDNKLYNLIGAILGKIIFEKVTIDIHFDYPFLKQLTNNQIQLDDIITFDKQLYSSWKMILQEQITSQLCLTFSIFQNGINYNLIPNGDKIQVNQLNKKQFIQKCIYFYCVQPYKKIIDQIRSKLNQVIPIKYLNIFKPQQLEIIINGVDYINIEDWKSGTIYRQGFAQNHKIILWFWKVLDTFTQQQLGNLLKYVTGSSRLPIFGFKKLQTNRGNNSCFTIQPMKYDKKNCLPRAHTCFNRLLLPLYPNQQTLEYNLKLLVNIQFQGFWGLQ